MKYIVLESEKTPAYLQLYRQIRDDIVNKVYNYGGRLPSKRMLADDAGVSTVTVEHAYALLCDEGYAEAMERSGYYVIFRSSDGFAAASDHVSAHIHTVNQNVDTSTLFPISLLTKTMRRVMADYGSAILERAPNSGCIELRDAIRLYLARNRGICTESDQIIIGSGSEYLYGLIVELLGRKKVYAIEYPSYKKIEQVYRAYDAEYELLPLGADGIDSKALAASRADVLHTTPYRSFPSGVTATASKRHEYIRWSNQSGRFVVEDDFESEFSVSAKPSENLFALSEHDNVIYMNSFSRTISPSLRVGYMVLPKCLVKPFGDKLGFYSCTVPTFEQLVLTELISSGDFERHINRVRRKIRRILE